MFTQKTKIRAECPYCKELGLKKGNENELEYIGIRDNGEENIHLYKCKIGHISNIYEVYDYNVKFKIKKEGDVK